MEGFSTIAYYAVIILVMVGLFYFMSRSNKKREREQLLMLDSLQVGDEVVTIGGIMAKSPPSRRTAWLLRAARTRTRSVSKRAPLRPFSLFMSKNQGALWRSLFHFGG